MTLLALTRGALGILANAAVEFWRPHRCPVVEYGQQCDFKDQNLGVVAVHAKQHQEGIDS